MHGARGETQHGLIRDCGDVLRSHGYFCTASQLYSGSEMAGLLEMSHGNRRDKPVVGNRSFLTLGKWYEKYTFGLSNT